MEEHPNTTPPINRWSSQEPERKKPWGILSALLLTIAIHLGLFLFLREIKFFKQFQQDLSTDTFRVEQVLVDTPELQAEAHPVVEPDTAKQPEVIPELDDILAEVRDLDIDISTDIQQPELAIQMSTPAQAGKQDGVVNDVLLSATSLSALDSIGIDILDNTEAMAGQLVIEEGGIKGELLDPNDVLDDSVLKGVGGRAAEGVMEGYSSLDDLMSMSAVNLQGARSALPSDLLFEYDSARLKAGARFGLMKLGMLINNNPSMYCILEGHTDTHGTTLYNNTLSTQRAQEVKNYLVQSLHLNEKQIIIRGYGKHFPLVKSGTPQQQAPNRRVDILMRKKIPSRKQVSLPQAEVLPKKIQKPVITATPQPQPQPQKTPTPAPIKKARVVEEAIQPVIVAPPVQPRQPIKVKPHRHPKGFQAIPKARIVEEAPPRAIIIEQ